MNLKIETVKDAITVQSKCTEIASKLNSLYDLFTPAQREGYGNFVSEAIAIIDFFGDVVIPEMKVG